MSTSKRPTAVYRIRQAVSAAIAGVAGRSPAPRAGARTTADHAVLERLEDRTLMAGDGSIVQSLPFSLEFDGPRASTLVDKDGEGTGFTWAQPNKLGNEFQPALIDLRPSEGVLYLTTTGTSAAGGPYEGDNTLANALQTQFNAATGSFTITVRIKGPLADFDTPNEQGGIYFGPDQDNYIKLVAIAQADGQYLQLIDEQKASGGTTYSHSLSGSAALANVGSFSAINTLDLELAGDAATGKVTAFYRINGGALTKLGQQITLSSSKKAAFFNAASKAGLIAMRKNDAATPFVVGFDRFEIVQGTPVESRPSVTDTNPAAGATGVRRDIFLDANVRLPTAGKGIDVASLSAGTVKIYRTSDRAPVAANVNTSGGGDSITLTPTVLLEANTQYTFEVTDGLRDTAGSAFVPFTMTFTTGTEVTPVDPTVAFEKVSLPATQGQQYTSLTIGPDGKMYAATITGLIYRFSIDPADGTLSAPQVIQTVQAANGGQRMLTGLVFDPSSTATNLVLWASHGQYATENASDFTGKISRLSGVNLEDYQDYVVNLPRSVRDHMTNQIDFGPDGALYIPQASNTAMGAPDSAWGMRPERLLSGAILRLDTAAAATRIAANAGAAINVMTPDAGGAYNPFAAGAPLTIYASGVRNAFDIVWHSNGQLYAPTNGSAANGAVPGYDGTSAVPQRIDGPYAGGAVSAVANVLMTEPDYLYRVTPGGYYGHPNPARGEYVLNGGNPTAGVDLLEMNQYPVGTRPDQNYRPGDAYVMGRKLSPDGIVEYRGPAFGGALNGRLLVTRFAGGDDVVALRVGADGSIVNEPQTTINGLTGFVDPLDVTVDPATGNLYVSEYDENNTGNRRITLLRPLAPGANVEVQQTRMFLNDVRGGSASPNETLVIKNTGTAPLAIPSDGLKVVGPDAAMFIVTPPAGMTLPLTVPAGASLLVNVAFKAAGNATFTIKTATLQIKSNDADQPFIEVSLRGLPTAGTGGQNEPSLQKILDLYQIPTNVGDVNPDNTNLYSDSEPLNPVRDEVDAQRFVKAGPGDVTIEPLALFGGSTAPSARFGWYLSGTKDSKRELFTVGKADAQTVNVTPDGTTRFDPGAAATFGFYSVWPIFANREAYSEDALNTQELTAANQRKVHVYLLRNADGSVVPDAYIVTQEDYVNDLNGAYDGNDVVAIIRNVRPAAAGPEVGTENLDGAPSYDRMVFNRIQQQPPAPKQQWDPATQTFVTYQPPNNVVHDTATLRVRNTGGSPLTINSLVLSNAAWTLVNPPAPGTPIPAGGALDLVVKFVAATLPPGQTENQTVGAAANTGGVWSGTLTINTDDADEPSTVVGLSGWWQQKSEQNMEPTLPVLVNRMFGYSTTVLNTGEALNTGGRAGAVGEEVLSPYWLRSDSTKPVTVRQLVAYHSQGPTETVKWFTKGGTSFNPILTHDGVEGQSLLPHLNDGTLANFAQGTFNTSSLFGFKVQASNSDDSLNQQESPGGNYGHKVRFFPLRDSAGRLVADTWLMVMDYWSSDPVSGALTSNFDYQDNVYLVSNMRPGVAAPTGLGTGSASDGIALNWADNAEATLSGYNVYRSLSATGTFTKLAASPVGLSQFVDATAAVGTTYYYRVTAVSSWGAESAVSLTVSGVRTTDTVPPAPPTGLSASGEPSGIRLVWAGSAEPDVVGYRVYRLAAADDASPHLVGGAQLVTATTFLDATAPAGQTWFYRVTAVDASGNESDKSDAASAVRPATDLPPQAPAELTVASGFSGINLRWNPNQDPDLAGYNVYRGTPGGTDFVKLNGAPLPGPLFDDTAAAAGRSWEYRVTAVDAAGHESAAASATATRPSPSAPAVALTAPAAVNEGALFQLTLGEVTYSGTGAVTRYTVRWGDGTTEDFATPGVKTHVYADGSAVRDVFVDLFDGTTTYAAAGTVRVAVNDVAPALFAVGTEALPVNGEEDLQLFVTDPGDDAITGWVVNWGDGSAAESVATGVARARHRYARPGAYTVSASVTNDDGTFSDNLIVVTVTDNGGPVATPDVPATLTARGPAPFIFSVTYADDVSVADPAADAITVIGPNGFSAVAQVVSVAGSGATRTVKYSLNAPGGAWDAADNGRYDVRLRGGAVQDAAGNAAAGGVLASFQVAVADAPPGTTPDTAIDLGLLQPKGRKLTRDLLAGERGQLYYKVTTTAAMRLCTAMGGLRGNADLELLKADGTRIAVSANRAKRGEKTNSVLPAGTYLVEVNLNGSPTTPFKLSLLGKTASKKVLAAAHLL